MSLRALTLAAEGHSELPIHPYAVGGLALGLLLAALLALIVFGGGRDHS